MAKIKVYIASSLDGFIARKNDSIDWLESIAGEKDDYGFTEFIKGVGACVMGGKTFAQCLKHPERFIMDLRHFVVAKPVDEFVPPALRVEYISGDLKEAFTKISRSMVKDLWIVGGGKLISACLNEGLVDEVIHFVAPILLHEGVPLYPKLKRDVPLTLLDSKRYSSGIVRLHYALRQGE